MSHQNVQGRQRYNTLASPPLPNAFQRAVISTRESPRDARTASSQSHQRRKQAITLSGDGLAPPQLNADWSNPVVLEMRKGLLLDVGSVLNQFSKMDRNIRAFCEESSDHMARTKRLPRMAAQSSALPENSTIGKPAHEFGSPEEYIFFVLLSTINTHLYEDIFRPFHPAASVQESDRYEEEYLEMIDTSLQMQSATWRSQKFSLIDNRMSADGVANLIRRFAGTIIDELAKVLEQSTGPTSFPDSFMSGLESILKDAYDWNRTVRKDILKYDFEPYVVEPSATWDPTQMESFERLRIPMRPNSNVISPVSLGLVGSVSLGGSRVSHVQRKARVLVEEWFLSAPRGRTTSAHPKSPSGKSTPSIPPPISGKPAARVTGAQPPRTQAMTVAPQPHPPKQVPPPKEKKGFLCC